ncbi:hypothetical protein BDR26DRAFT_958792 [Obelidium mucronatum]|nr:hypothetical protein BDR26DRAFT_958792 [Obelidium mucronatum]
MASKSTAPSAEKVKETEPVNPHPNATLLEKAWLGYHVFVHVSVGIANLVAPFEILQTRIERSGGDSLQQLFADSVGAVEAAEAALSSPSPSAAAATNTSSSSPYAAAVAGSLAPRSANAAAAERLAAARSNLDSLAALVASALFQTQYGAATDALLAGLALHGLRTSAAAERRLVHRVLGLAKTAQYAVYLAHEASTNGALSYLNIVGLGATVAATYVFGFKPRTAVAAKKPASSSSSSSTATATPSSSSSSPY